MGIAKLDLENKLGRHLLRVSGGSFGTPVIKLLPSLYESYDLTLLNIDQDGQPIGVFYTVDEDDVVLNSNATWLFWDLGYVTENTTYKLDKYATYIRLRPQIIGNTAAFDFLVVSSKLY